MVFRQYNYGQAQQECRSIILNLEMIRRAISTVTHCNVFGLGAFFCTVISYGVYIIYVYKVTYHVLWLS